MTKVLSKSQILECSDVQIIAVDVPEWNGTVFLKSMTGAERDEFEQTTFTTDGKGREKRDLANLRARLLVRVICDDKGNRLFTDAEAFGLGKKNSSVLNRLFDKANEINATSAGDAEKLEKNSDADLTDTSTLNSQESSEKPSANSSEEQALAS